MKQKFAIIIVAVLSFNLQTSAFDVGIALNQREVSVDDYFTLQIEVQMDDWKDLEVEEIKWLENFELISSSQSQASSTSISVINWKAETISKFVNSINLVLKPLNEWKFLLWPVVIRWEDEVKETNSLEVSVLGSRNSIYIWSDDVDEIEEIVNDELLNESGDIERLSNKHIIYFFAGGILIILLLVWIIFYVRRNDFWVEDDEKMENENDGMEDDFENEEMEVYPRVSGKNFVLDIEKVFRNKLSKKYGIKKSYDEISNLLNNDLIDSENKKVLRDIVDNINKLKYSNVLVDKAKLLEMVKKF